MSEDTQGLSEAVARLRADCDDGRQLGRMVVTSRADVRAVLAALEVRPVVETELLREVYDWLMRYPPAGTYGCTALAFKVRDALTDRPEAQEEARPVVETSEVHEVLSDLNRVRPDDPSYILARRAIDCMVSLSVSASNARAALSQHKGEGE